MDELPVELQCLILKSLPLSDLITCSKVCELWQSIVESFKITSFVISGNDRLPINKKWFFTQERVDYSYSFLNCKLDQINLREKTLSKIKSIYIYSVDSYLKTFDIGLCLNSFEQLEKLQVYYLELETQSQLTLPNLRIFSASNIKGSLLILNTPELECLKILTSSGLRNVELVYPLKIKWLETYALDEVIFKFKNLEHLFCKFIRTPDDSIVHRLKRLVHLSIDQDPHVFNELKRQCISQGREETLTICFFGFKFDELPDFSFNFNTYYLYDKNIPLYKTYYDLTYDYIPFINVINYSDLEAAFGSDIPSGLAKKFNNLCTILVEHEIEDKVQFSRFFAQCSSITILGLLYSSSNLYSDLLDTVCPRVQLLKLRGHSIELFESLFKKYRNLYSISSCENVSLNPEYEYRYANQQLQVTIHQKSNGKREENGAILIV